MLDKIKVTTQKDERRQQLIDGTIHAISKYGLSGTTVQKVATEAGLSVGTIGFYFDGKEKLLLGTLEYLSREFREILEEALSKPVNPMQRLLAVIDTYFYSEISDNIGQYVLLNFFTGKYHHPVEEERIFMFLDMKSSTNIAEKLGHIKYYEFLKEYYSDLSDAIVAHAGQIYQYVGDEVVVTWKIKSDKNNINCIDCFFSMKQLLIEKQDKYLKKYGVAPTFKAGIHLGKVTTGEIGKIKKDFMFTGDVLNTTARIQELCNKYEVKLLVSKKIVDLLSFNMDYKTIELGKTTLRGKDEKITLFSIEEY